MARKTAQGHSGTSTPSRSTFSPTTNTHSASSSNTPATTGGNTGTHTKTSPITTAAAASNSNNSNSSTLRAIIPQIWNTYIDKTPQRTKLIDAFMAFLLAVGGLQFVYCVLFGTYPYNAFLSGFGITVGQFVLTASLRMQTNVENAAEFKSVSAERAFADFVLGSLILHFFCVNFIN